MTTPPPGFVFRGHWEGRDSTNGQYSDGDTWSGQKCFGYHCNLPGEVNVQAYFTIVKNVFPGFFPLTWAPSSCSHPKEVCSVILDAECMRPIHTMCNMVEPSIQCQLVLRHFFNDSGVYCINVSVANDVSLAATSARVSVDMGNAHIYRTQQLVAWVCVSVAHSVIFVSGSSLSSPGTVATVLGVLVLLVAVGVAAYSYK